MLARKLSVYLILLLTLSIFRAAGPAFATPSGLNNIPTADVTPQTLLVLQAFSNFGTDLDTSWFAGFKVGAAEHWELGLDGQVAGTGAGGGPTFQVKYQLPPQPRTKAALGLANISGDRQRHGEFFPYAVISSILSPRVNGHLGYSFQSNNHALFLGMDTPVSESLTLRSDWIQTDDGDESVWSLGFINQISGNYLVEGWSSFPSAAGAETNYVLKLDYVIPLKN